jgi:hypothetical protein
VASRKVGWASAWRPSPTEKRLAERHRARSPVARWQLASGKVLPVSSRGPQGGPSGKAVGGGAHPSGDTAWRQWRMIRAAAFNDGEVAPVTDDIDGVAL